MEKNIDLKNNYSEIILKNVMVINKVFKDVKLNYKCLTQGRNELSDLKYYTYTFDKEIDGYDCIMLSLYKIDIIEQEEASKSIIYKNVTTSSLPHIDGNTGNIHPRNESINEHLDNNYINNNIIKQIVLCKSNNSKKLGSHPGPKNNESIDLTDCYNYDSKTIIHKSCYFPRIDNKKPKNDWRYDFLKKVAEQLPFELLSGELKDYIRET